MELQRLAPGTTTLNVACETEACRASFDRADGSPAGWWNMWGPMWLCPGHSPGKDEFVDVDIKKYARENLGKFEFDFSEEDRFVSDRVQRMLRGMTGEVVAKITAEDDLKLGSR